ncbi:xyloglucan-specific galacturonosyltransferase 1-like [Solanum dulcamara]|uniref:xyloglucan-specific galacturonosyltransferase 1-like n=1 Tax=Solanum dulcamara TaxID=45834 RepID=UPI002485C513|nr:xyloglucan-specific galacturonosyltransferase 1-like [Solanum dulcamara]
MAISVSKKKAKINKRVEHKESFFFSSFLAKLRFRIPSIVIILTLIFLWSSSTTIISGKVVHVCISSRKLNDLYCISAGTEPNIDTAVSPLNGTSHSVFVDQKDTASKESSPSDTRIAIVDENSTLIDTISNVVDVSLQKSSPLDIPIPRVNDSVTSNDTTSNVVDVSSPLDIPIPRVNDSSTSIDTISNVVDVSLQKSSPLDIPISRVNDGVTIIPSVKQESTITVDSFSGNKNVSFRNSMVKSGDEELMIAYNDVEDQLQVHRSWAATSKNNATCDGRGIYVYDLPTKFNKDLVAQCADINPWVNLCKYFSNDAMGEPIQNLGKGWYQTHQYSLELIFHSRVLNHPCRVHNADEAKLFYVPFYGGLDILRWHFKNVSNDVKDSLGVELVRWLESQKHWFQKSGNDHVFALGKISWDFRRYSNTIWGSRFLELDEMQNPVKLLIERQPWQVNDIGIPHPTYFHPQSDNDIIAWQDRTIKSNRKSLVSFAGAARPDAPENIRSILINQCTSANDQECRFLNCNLGKCDQPESIIELFMESEFCLQPPGDSPTRKSVFDSLISGCIPVIFDPFTAYYQYSWHLPEDHKKYSVFIDQEDVRRMKVNVVERLMQIPTKERENMRSYIIYELLPGLVYGDPKSKLEKYQDAFSITINNLFQRLNKLEL